MVWRCPCIRAFVSVGYAIIFPNYFILDSRYIGTYPCMLLKNHRSSLDMRIMTNFFIGGQRAFLAVSDCPGLFFFHFISGFGLTAWHLTKVSRSSNLAWRRFAIPGCFMVDYGNFIWWLTKMFVQRKGEYIFHPKCHNYSDISVTILKDHAIKVIWNYS